jgi:lipoprotein signal peptidase
MKSIQKLAQIKMNKRGQVGLDTAKTVMLTLLTIGVIAFAIIIALANLNTSNATTAGSLERNQTTNIFNNITSGTASFFSNAGTWFSLLAVVVIILIISIVIFAVNRFGGGRGGGL